MSHTAWEQEFERYKAFPEFKRLRDAKTFSMDEFKRIYYWEWGHRFLGRAIGVVYGVPWLYFVATGRIRGPLLWQSGALLALGGAQGAVGWWMVKSGLQEDLDHPRVDHRRLATHLGCALVIYSGLMWLGLNETTKDKIISIPTSSSVASSTSAANVVSSSSSSIPPYVRRFRWLSLAALTAVFGTALTGAYVAGRDAGLVHSHTIIIPREDREKDYDARLQWRHRVTAVGVTTSLLVLSVAAHRFPLPARTLRFAKGMALVAVAQASLGVATLWTLVDTAVAAAHQFGSVMLLTVTLHFAHDFSRLVRKRV